MASWTWLTAKEAAARIGRSVSLIRYWHGVYGPALPMRLDEDGRKVFPLEILLEIAAMRSRGLNAREIKAALEGRSPDAPPAPPDRVVELLELLLAETRKIVALLEARERG